MDDFCQFLIPKTQIFWKLWLKNIYYLGYQLYTQVKQDFRGWKAPIGPRRCDFYIFFYYFRCFIGLFDKKYPQICFFLANMWIKIDWYINLGYICDIRFPCWVFKTHLIRFQRTFLLKISDFKHFSWFSWHPSKNRLPLFYRNIGGKSSYFLSR